MKDQGTLVLTRKANETLSLTVPPSTDETEIHIQVAGIRGGQVRLACHAPKRVNIVRRELVKVR